MTLCFEKITAHNLLKKILTQYSNYYEALTFKGEYVRKVMTQECENNFHIDARPHNFPADLSSFGSFNTFGSNNIITIDLSFKNEDNMADFNALFIKRLVDNNFLRSLTETLDEDFSYTRMVLEFNNELFYVTLCYNYYQSCNKNYKSYMEEFVPLFTCNNLKMTNTDSVHVIDNSYFLGQCLSDAFSKRLVLMPNVAKILNPGNRVENIGYLSALNTVLKLKKAGWLINDYWNYQISEEKCCICHREENVIYNSYGDSYHPLCAIKYIIEHDEDLIFNDIMSSREYQWDLADLDDLEEDIETEYDFDGKCSGIFKLDDENLPADEGFRLEEDSVGESSSIDTDEDSTTDSSTDSRRTVDADSMSDDLFATISQDLSTTTFLEEINKQYSGKDFSKKLRKYSKKLSERQPSENLYDQINSRSYLSVGSPPYINSEKQSHVQINSYLQPESPPYINSEPWPIIPYTPPVKYQVLKLEGKNIIINVATKDVIRGLVILKHEKETPTILSTTNIIINPELREIIETEDKYEGVYNAIKIGDYYRIIDDTLKDCIFIDDYCIIGQICGENALKPLTLSQAIVAREDGFSITEEYIR